MRYGPYLVNSPLKLTKRKYCAGTWSVSQTPFSDKKKSNLSLNIANAFISNKIGSPCRCPTDFAVSMSLLIRKTVPFPISRTIIFLWYPDFSRWKIMIRVILCFFYLRSILPYSPKQRTHSTISASKRALY